MNSSIASLSKMISAIVAPVRLQQYTISDAEFAIPGFTTKILPKN